VISNYDTLILDVDGVILDSNKMKAQNIHFAATPFAKKVCLDDFVRYFISMNGVPREGKIAKYFGDGTDETKQILAEYTRRNIKSLLKVNLTEGVKEFLNRWKKRCTIYAISGGDEAEVKMVLTHNKIHTFFTEILGGPISKSTHLRRLNIAGKTLFIGDSKHDFLVAKEFGFKFIFMYQYTQFDGWEEYFQNQPDVLLIKNLTECP